MNKKNLLLINLSKKSFEITSIEELYPYLGGLSMGLKTYEIYHEQDPLILAIGPLNGFFPYASKTCIVLNTDNIVEDLYLGGSLSTRLRFAGIDAVVFLGASQEKVSVEYINNEVKFYTPDTRNSRLGLPGKRSVLEMVENKALHDDYFMVQESILERKLKEKNLQSFTITAQKTFDIKNNLYSETYNKILEMKNKMEVVQETYPSCAGCPMGCIHSKIGETGGNVLVHSLVGCTYSQQIYSDLGIVFSCLNSIGETYTHEDLEKIPVLIKETLIKIKSL